MHILHLHVENLKLLKNVSVDFRRGGSFKHFTVLLGENGTCKTALLQSIALAASGATRAQQLASVPSLRDRRLDDDKQSVHVSAAFSFGADYHGIREYPGLKEPERVPILDSGLSLKKDHTDFAGRSSYRPDLHPVRSVDDPLAEARSRQLGHWFIAGYGVSRMLSVPLSAREPSDLALERLEPLFGQRTIIGAGFSDILPDDLSRAFADALRGVLTGPEGLLPRVSQLELRGHGGVRKRSDLVDAHRFTFDAGGQGIKVPATWMSQGYQSTIAWISDLIGQVYWEAGAPVPTQEMEGIVLIDELDLHLHPTWQAALVRTLKHHFPKVQFIATTHSPMVLSGLDADEVLLLELDDDGDVQVREPDIAPALRTGDELFELFFGVDEPPPTLPDELLETWGLLAGDPERTDDQERELHGIVRRLQERGVQVPKPVPRRETS